MRVFKRWILIGIVGIGSLVSTVHADRLTLQNNDWNGMTLMTAFAGNVSGGAGLYDPNVLRQPMSVLQLKDGSVIVADTGNQVIKKVTGGELSVWSGVTVSTDDRVIGALVDGPAHESSYYEPHGLAEDAAGNIYVADAGNHAIRKIDTKGNVTTIAGDGVIGLADGTGGKARFYYPTDVAVAGDGTIYVADTLNHVIRKIDRNGNVTTLNAPSDRIVEIIPGIVETAGDYRDGPIASAKFNEPSGLALDAKGNLYVSDTGNQRIRYIDFAKGTVTTVAGGAFADANAGILYNEGELYAPGGYADGAAAEARFHGPKGIAVTKDGGLLIADSENHVIRYLHNGKVTTVAGVPGQHGYVNGIERHNVLYRPADVAVTADGRMLIADSYNGMIRQVKLYELPVGLRITDDIQVIYNGKEIEFESSPAARNGRTMVQARFVAEALGYEVGYEAEDQRVIMSKGERVIVFRLGQTKLFEREGDRIVREMEMDVAPYAESNRTYVPVRFFAEVIGMDVEWIQNERLVIIRDKIVP